MRDYWGHKSYYRGWRHGNGLVHAMQGLLWPMGIFFLIYTGWWFPGIFVLIILSSVLSMAAKYRTAPSESSDWQADPPTAPQPPLRPIQPTALVVNMRLPSECPGCGAPVGNQTIKLGQPQRCNYCHRHFQNT